MTHTAQVNNSQVRLQQASLQQITLNEPTMTNPHTDALLHDSKRLLLQTLGALLLLGALLGAASYLFKPEMESLSKALISQAGLWAVGLGFMIPDALTLPIPPDTFLVAGYLGGLDFWEMTLWGGVGSVLGGTLGYSMIRLLSKRPRVQAWLAPKMERGQALMDRYGLLALALAALTPLPYSVICWVCGATNVRAVPFVLVSLLRIPRVALYLVFIEQTMSLT
jgi:membrane protein YqaA with SNARE-associated domain